MTQLFEGKTVLWLKHSTGQITPHKALGSKEEFLESAAQLGQSNLITAEDSSLSVDSRLSVPSFINLVDSLVSSRLLLCLMQADLPSPHSCTYRRNLAIPPGKRMDTARK